jgi:hypothetical protein
MYRIVAIWTVIFLMQVQVKADITLLEESFENGFGEWQQVSGENDTTGTEGWQIVETSSAPDGSSVVEIQSFEPGFGECVNKDKALRSPSVAIENFDIIHFSYLFDFERTNPDVDYKASALPFTVHVMSPEQAAAIDRGLMTIEDTLQVTNISFSSNKQSWGQATGSVSREDFADLGTHFILSIRYRNSESKACERLRIDVVRIAGEVVADVLDTRIVKPETFTGVRFFMLRETVAFKATTGPDEPEASNYVWNFWNADTGALLFSANGATLSQGFNEPGNYRLDVAAYNAQGQPDPTPAVLFFRVVESIDIRPSIVAPSRDVERVHVGESVTFRAGIENPTKRSVPVVEWRITPLGSERSPFKASGMSYTHTFEKRGKFLVELLVKTSDGFIGVDLDTMTVEVADAFVNISSPKPARGQRGKILLEADQPTQFTADVKAIDGSEGEIVWWRYPDAQEVCRGTDTCSITFTESGNQAVAVMMMRGEEVVAKDMIYVTVSPGIYTQIAEPTPNAYFAINEPIRFSTQVTGSKAEGATVEWMLGTNTATGQEIVKESGIPFPGTYQAKVVAIASDGSRFRDSVRFTVFDPESIGDGAIVSPRTNLTIKPNVPVFFDAILRITPDEHQRPMWRISNIDSGELIKEGFNLVAGKLRFGFPGNYRAEFFIRSESGEKMLDSRDIRVIASNPDEYDSNSSLDDAAEMSFGRYHNMTLNRGHFFETEIPEDGLTLKVSTSQFEGEARIVLFDENLNNLVRRKISGSEPFQLASIPAGTYRWGILPIDEASAKRNLSFSLSIEVLNPALFFTDIQADENFDTEIGFVNPTNGEAQVQVSAFDEAGQLLGKIDMILGDGASLKDSINNLFPNVAADIAWVGVDSTRELVGFANIVSLKEDRAYAVSGVSHLSDQLFVPHIAQTTDTWFTEARVINGISESADPTLESGDFQNPLDLSTSFSKSSFDFLNIFGGTITTGDRWARFFDTMGQAALGGNEVFGTKDNTRIVGLGLADLPSKNPSFTAVIDRIFFTHIANPNDFWTAMALVNTSEIDTDVEIIAYAENGTRLGSRFQNIPGFGTYTDIATSFLGDIENAENAGWVEVLHSGTVMGYELFGTNSNKQMAGLEAITDLKSEICFPYLDASGKSYHGFSVVNPEAASMNVTFQLYTASGEVSQEVVRELAPKEKQIFLFEDLFGQIAIDAGWIKAMSDAGSLAGFQLFGNPETMSGLIAQ